MPLFDFRCNCCCKEFEALVFGSDQPKCPFCGGSELQKLMSGFSVRGQSSKKGADGDSGGSSKCSGCAGGSCASCH